MAATVGAMILGQTLAAAGTTAFFVQYAVGYLAYKHSPSWTYA